MQSKEWSTKKKIVAGIIAVLLIFALIIGIIYIAVYSNRGKVIVVPLDDITYYDDEDDEANIEGTISTGVTQDVTLDQGNVTEILVEQGAYVKKGDALVRFDSTAANMQLEQARINLEGLKVDLTTANNKLTMLDQAEKYVETVKVPVTDITDTTTTDTTATTDTTGTAADTTATTDTTGTTASDTTSTTDDATDSEEEVEYQEV
nr:biotin/lipoyl-binding protein [Lachnospiraceae bacterium]